MNERWTISSKAKHGDAYYIAALAPFRSRACWLALLFVIDNALSI